MTQAERTRAWLQFRLFIGVYSDADRAEVARMASERAVNIFLGEIL